MSTWNRPSQTWITRPADGFESCWSGRKRCSGTWNKRTARPLRVRFPFFGIRWTRLKLYSPVTKGASIELIVATVIDKPQTTTLPACNMLAPEGPTLKLGPRWIQKFGFWHQCVSFLKHIMTTQPSLGKKGLFGRLRWLSKVSPAKNLIRGLSMELILAGWLRGSFFVEQI